MKTKKISDFVNINYKSFAIYTALKRGLPGLYDGLKPVQRKAWYCANKDLKKVSSLTGDLMSKANYHHGDAAANGAISKMAQDFPGGNNYPLLHKKGNFGNKLVKTPSAARYIYVKRNPLFEKIFKDDFLHKCNSDKESPEPAFFLPIIPTILLNGISGIAVGFAVDIQPYNMLDIINYIKAYILKKPTPELKPFYKGFNGDIINKDEKYIMYGKWEKVNTTTIKITEIPVNHDRLGYIKHLINLRDKGLIVSYKDESKESWNLTVKLARNSVIWEDPIKYLKLSLNLKQNFTVVDSNDVIIVFDTVYELINHFIDYRIGVYDKRIAFMKNKIKNDIIFNKNKIKFIKHLSSLSFKKMTKNEINERMKEKYDFIDDHLDKFMQIPVYNLNTEYIEGLQKKILDLKVELSYYKKVKNITLYNIDLENI